MNTLKRLDELKACLAEEKRLALELSEKFQEAPFKDQAMRLADSADEIESIFLADDALNRSRLEAGEAKFLDSFERSIRMLVTPQRELLQDIFQKYGPKVTLIGG